MALSNASIPVALSAALTFRLSSFPCLQAYVSAAPCRTGSPFVGSVWHCAALPYLAIVQNFAVKLSKIDRLPRCPRYACAVIGAVGYSIEPQDRAIAIAVPCDGGKLA